MKIKTVTITGADNETRHQDLFDLSKEFPFVEWGILFSPKRLGSERYPDFNWLNELKRLLPDNPLTLSAHLCGEYTRQMLVGKSALIDNLPFSNCMDIFSRFQLNFNYLKNESNQELFFALLQKLDKRFILQSNYSNAGICAAANLYSNIDFLYDSSGGRGNSPEQWRAPFQNHFTGYSGGLSPDNLEGELEKIEQVVGDNEIWIDTETHVRTNEILDMQKVKQFLTIASKYAS